MGKIKTKEVESTVADAVSAAFGELESLAEECREVVDNAPEGLRSTARIEMLDQAASELESLSEPDVPDYLGPTKVTYAEWSSARKGRGLSRGDRCAAACAIVEDVVSVLNEELDDADSDKRDEIEALRDELDQARETAEGLEFPGMFG